MTPRSISPLVVALIPLACGSARARADDTTPVTGRIVRAALFKNGIAVVSREVAATAGPTVTIEGLPPALHGTFWLRPSEGMTIERAVASPSARTVREPATSVLDVLRANVGRSVEVQLEDGWMAARILDVPEPALAPELPASWPRRDNPYAYYAAAARLPVPDATLVLLEDASGTTWALPPAAVKTVRGRELARDVERRESAVSLCVDVAGRGGTLALDQAVPGLAWAPSYRVELGSGGKARLELRAEILDDLEDIDHAEVSLVTGFPHLRFDDVPDPLTTTATLQHFLQLLAQSGTARAMQPVVLQNAMMVGAQYGERPAGQESRNAGDEFVENLHFFPLRDVTLRRGERSSHEVLTQQVDARTIHVWRVDEGVPQDVHSWQRRPQDGTTKPPEVWQVVRLTNAGSVPWTTGAAITTKGGRLLGQDVLSFTPPGGTTDVRVTRAAGIRAEQSATEASRSRLHDGRSWDLVTVDAQLELTNATAEDVIVEVVKGPLPGDVLSSDPPARTRKLGDELQSGNPRHELSWEVQIRAGDRAVLAYRYLVRVPA